MPCRSDPASVRHQQFRHGHRELRALHDRGSGIAQQPPRRRIRAAIRSIGSDGKLPPRTIVGA
jgi:hypothetical protein